MSDEKIENTTVAVKLKQLEERFQARLKETYKLIETIERESLTDLSEAHIEQLIIISHKLAGSSGTFGFAQLSKDMKTYEQKLLKAKDTFNQISNEAFSAFCQEGLLILNRVIQT